MKHTSIEPRRGLGVIWLVVVMAVLVIMMTSFVVQFMASKRSLIHREYQRQALWLARAGIEVGRQKGAMAEYEETLELLPDSEVKIVVKDEKDQVRITCEVRYPKDSIETVVRTMTRQYKRVGTGAEARLEWSSRE